MLDECPEYTCMLTRVISKQVNLFLKVGGALILEKKERLKAF